MLTLFKTVFGVRRVEKCSLETIIERTSTFLMPQLEMMEKIEGNKFGFITMQSVAYMINVAKEIGGRSIEDDEFEAFFVGVLGDEYQTMVEHRLKTIRDPRFDIERFAGMLKATGKISREDVRKGAHNSSNFLVAIAEDHAQWEKKVVTTN